LISFLPTSNTSRVLSDFREHRYILNLSPTLPSVETASSVPQITTAPWLSLRRRIQGLGQPIPQCTGKAPKPKPVLHEELRK
jgi:hypothetical protein